MAGAAVESRAITSEQKTAARPVLSSPGQDVTQASPEVRRAVRFMAQNYAQPITLGDLACLTNRSPVQVIRAFRRELGITPHAWLIHLRVSVATAMLQRGERISSVASDTGFFDQTHFTRHFKRLHGKTPARFLLVAQEPQ